jgi:hypothetical protein
MSEQPVKEPKEYICNDDDLGCLHDYLCAALAGNDITELPRLWNQQIGVIRSCPYSNHQSERDKVLDEVYKCLEAFAIPTIDLTYVTWDDIDCLFAELRSKRGEQR